MFATINARLHNIGEMDKGKRIFLQGVDSRFSKARIYLTTNNFGRACVFEGSGAPTVLTVFGGV